MAAATPQFVKIITIALLLHITLSPAFGGLATANKISRNHLSRSHSPRSKHESRGRKQHTSKPSPQEIIGSKSERGPSYPYNTKVFDVLAYGARGDGLCDDTQAFLATWQEACMVESAVFVVPEYFTFIIRPIIFSGPCAPNMVFQVDGTISAPDSIPKWRATKNLLQWINFSRLHGFTLRGSGLVDGMGTAWWSSCKSNYVQAGLKRNCRSMVRPTAVRFYGSNNVTVENLHIRNSPQTHLKFDSCVGVRVRNITVNSPQTSPNTDGIHIQNTQDVEICESLIENGDDCVSIQTGSSDLRIHNIVCRNGHGISVGALGRDQTQACVSNITVQDVTIQNSQNGVRIKTWQGGSGSVKSVSFSNVIVENISNPIIIDQFYCDSGKACRNQSSAVQVFDITYKNIRGTYMKSSPLHFACSNTVPCHHIMVAQVELLPQHGFYVDEPFCWNIYGSSQMPTIPPIQCLQSGVPPSLQKQSSLLDGC